MEILCSNAFEIGEVVIASYENFDAEIFCADIEPPQERLTHTT